MSSSPAKPFHRSKTKGEPAGVDTEYARPVMSSLVQVPTPEGGPAPRRGKPHHNKHKDATRGNTSPLESRDQTTTEPSRTQFLTPVDSPSRPKAPPATVQQPTEYHEPAVSHPSLTSTSPPDNTQRHIPVDFLFGGAPAFSRPQPQLFPPPQDPSKYALENMLKAMLSIPPSAMVPQPMQQEPTGHTMLGGGSGITEPTWPSMLPQSAWGQATATPMPGFPFLGAQYPTYPQQSELSTIPNVEASERRGTSPPPYPNATAGAPPTAASLFGVLQPHPLAAFSGYPTGYAPGPYGFPGFYAFPSANGATESRPTSQVTDPQQQLLAQHFATLGLGPPPPPPPPIPATALLNGLFQTGGAFMTPPTTNISLTGSAQGGLLPSEVGMRNGGHVRQDSGDGVGEDVLAHLLAETDREREEAMLAEAIRDAETESLMQSLKGESSASSRHDAPSQGGASSPALPPSDQRQTASGSSTQQQQQQHQNNRRRERGSGSGSGDRRQQQSTTTSAPTMPGPGLLPITIGGGAIPLVFNYGMRKETSFLDRRPPPPLSQPMRVRGVVLPPTEFGVLEPDVDKRLSSEARQMYEELLPTEAEDENRKLLLERLQGKVSKKWPGSELHLFGSSASGICVRGTSDVDICLHVPSRPAETDRKYLVQHLANLLKKNHYHNVTPLVHARVPIVKFKDPQTHFSCDVCVNNMLGVYNTRLMRDYCSFDPRAKQLAFLVKHFAKRRKLNDPLRGSLSSYGYVLMVIHFLQKGVSPPVLPCLQELRPAGQEPRVVDGCDCSYAPPEAAPPSANTMSTVELLAHFFYFYAHVFDFSTQVVSVRVLREIPREEKQWQIVDTSPFIHHELCIEDPFETGFNVGRIISKVCLQNIRFEFSRAHQMILRGDSLTSICQAYMDD